ncbi:hypothetical protein VTL71DRAFT_2417 [Oculimacula yallundae]|uniref:Uncharacterized protein n=1 Tax=Oculimacula yallundae TaxID=86028 RepID=A0ABR4CAR8_9HELO
MISRPTRFGLNANMVAGGHYFRLTIVVKELCDFDKTVRLRDLYFSDHEFGPPRRSEVMPCHRNDWDKAVAERSFAFDINVPDLSSAKY